MNIVGLLENKNGFRSLSSVNNAEILSAEETLNIKFDSDYKDILSKFGVVSFYGHELTGICKSKRLDVVDLTLNERESNKYANDLYVIEKTNVDDIIIWQSSNGNIYETKGKSKPVKIFSSLTEYLNN